MSNYQARVVGYNEQGEPVWEMALPGSLEVPSSEMWGREYTCYFTGKLVPPVPPVDQHLEDEKLVNWLIYSVGYEYKTGAAFYTVEPVRRVRRLTPYQRRKLQRKI